MSERDVERSADVLGGVRERPPPRKEVGFCRSPMSSPKASRRPAEKSLSQASEMTLPGVEYPDELQLNNGKPPILSLASQLRVPVMGVDG